MININHPVFHIHILEGQPAKLLNPHSCVEKDIKSFIILSVYIVIMNKFKELFHLLLGYCFSCFFVITNDPCKLESKWILNKHIIINRHLKSRAENSPHRFDGA